MSKICILFPDIFREPFRPVNDRYDVVEGSFLICDAATNLLHTGTKTCPEGQEDQFPQLRVVARMESSDLVYFSNEQGEINFDISGQLVNIDRGKWPRILDLHENFRNGWNSALHITNVRVLKTGGTRNDLVKKRTSKLTP